LTDQRVHALSVKSGRLLETTVENVHFDKNLGMAEITRESAEDLGQRSYHASERWWGRQESKRREQWPEHSVIKKSPRGDRRAPSVIKSAFPGPIGRNAENSVRSNVPSLSRARLHVPAKLTPELA
jgi:hypothetical protein